MKRADANNCLHLTVEIVEEIHAEAIASFGGLMGLRDRALLESAVATPQATIGGKSPYTDGVDIAASYLFYLCSNHAFIDGNKRTALGACLIFLKLNGYVTAPDGEEWETLTLAVASGSVSRDEATTMLRELVSTDS